MKTHRIALATFTALSTISALISGCSSSSSSAPTSGSSGNPGTTTSACVAPAGGPTSHQGNVGDETWTAAASPHLITTDTNVTGTLTVEPCAEILIAAGVTVSVTGTVLASGTSTTGIHIGAQDPQKPFVMIRTLSGGTLHLAYVNIDGGGDPSNIVADQTGTLNLQGTDGTQPPQETLFVDHVSISGSKTNGVVLRDGAGFASGSTALTVSGSALFPVHMWARAVDRLPDGSYTGNGIDAIDLPGGGGDESFAESATLHDRGVAYQAGDSLTGGDLYVDPLPLVTTIPTLTIDPGVTIRFKKGGSLHVTAAETDAPATAALIARGTSDAPIVFTSAEASPLAGDWLGILFGGQPLAGDVIDHARVEFAGGVSNAGSDSCPYPSDPKSDAAIRILGGPPGEIVTNTTISDSAHFGIDRGWRKDDTTDFLATNTFVNVASCHQSYPKSSTGTCPASVPCPQ